MKKILTLGVLAFMAISTVSCTSKLETKTETEVVTVDNDKIKTDIEGMETAYAQALNERNLDGIMAYYAEDAETYEGGQEPMIGKANIRKSIENQLKMMPAGMKIGFETKNLMISSDGAQVVENGSYKVTDTTNAEISSGSFMAAFKKNGEKYECVREMIVSNKKTQ